MPRSTKKSARSSFTQTRIARGSTITAGKSSAGEQMDGRPDIQSPKRPHEGGSSEDSFSSPLQSQLPSPESPSSDVSSLINVGDTGVITLGVVELFPSLKQPSALHTEERDTESLLPLREAAIVEAQIPAAVDSVTLSPEAPPTAPLLSPDGDV